MIVPQATPLQVVPETLHSTAGFVLPFTVAENWSFPPVPTCAVFGETETVTEDADCTTSEADPDLVGLATDTAVIVIAEDVGTLLGAV